MENLDKGISDLVNLLVDNHFNTFASCQGGLGHSFEYPTVRLYLDKFSTLEKTEKRIRIFLLKSGYGGFYTKIIRYAILKEIEENFIEIEFFNKILKP